MSLPVLLLFAALMIALVWGIASTFRTVIHLSDEFDAQLKVAKPAPPDLSVIKEDIGLRYEAFREERKVVVDQYHKTNENHEKTMIFLASGALVLSITFLEKIVHGHAQCLPLVAISWILFAISVHLTIKANRMSKAAFKRGIDVLDAMFWEGDELDNSYIGKSDRLELQAERFLWLAVIFLAIFSIINVGNSST